MSISTAEEETGESKGWCSWLKEKICGCSKRKKTGGFEEPFLSDEEDGADFTSEDLKQLFTNLQFISHTQESISFVMPIVRIIHRYLVVHSRNKGEIVCNFEFC